MARPAAHGTVRSGDRTTLSVAISDSADPTPGAETFDYSVVVDNTGDLDATGVTATVILDDSLTYVSASGTGWTCHLNGTHVVCVRDSIAGNDTAPTITVTVQPTDATATVSSSTSAVAWNAPTCAADAEATDTVSDAVLTLGLTDNTDPVATSTNYTYSVVVSNTGTVNPATGISAVVTLDAGLAFVSAAGTGWTCNNVSGVVTCTRTSIDPGTSAPTITVTVTSPADPASVTSTLACTATNAATPTPVNQITTVTDAAVAVLAIHSFTDSADPAPGNANFSYALAVKNTDATTAASNVTAVITLDGSLTFVSASGTGWTCNESGGVVTCTRASIGTSTTAPTITITVTPTNADASISSVTHAYADNAADTGDTTQGTTITGWATLSINSFTDSADPVITSDAYSYACAVRNTSAVNAASNITALITIPANATYVSASGTGWTCNESGGVVTCTRASLATSTTAPTITVNVTAAVAAESSSATASASADNAAGTGNTTQGTTIKFVTRDATATTKFFPATSTEWTDFIACKGLSVAVPTRLWLCQDSSGNAAAAIGAQALTATGTPSYNQAITGYTRTGLQCRDNTTDSFAMASGTGPNPSSTSITWLVFAKMPASPAATRTAFYGNNLASSTQETKVTHSSTGVLIDRCVAVATNGSTSVSSSVILTAHVYDRTNSASITYDATGDKITGTYSSSAIDGLKGFGRGANVTVGYAAEWDGSNAEISSTNMKALMTALGWGTPSWS